MRLLGLLLALSLSLQVVGQNNAESFCGTTGIDPWLDEYFSNIDQYRTEQSEVIYVPLTIHILGTDEGQGYFDIDELYASLCTLNEDFEDAQIQYYIQEPINYINKTSWYDHPNFSEGIEMMQQSNIPGTVNCYIVANPAGNCGYYTGRGNAIALRKGCNNRNDHTWAHELGHFFSLPHTFVGWEGIRWEFGKTAKDYEGDVRRQIEEVDGDNCDVASDRFCDTPPDYLSYRWTCDGSGFSREQMLDPDSAAFRADGTYFMSYANDACMNRFSFEQIQAMRANINSVRSELLKESFPAPILREEAPGNAYPADSSVVNPSFIPLLWEKIPGASHYILELSRLPNFSFTIIRERVNDNGYIIPELRPGIRYYWRVKAVNANSFCGSYSDGNMFLTSSLTSTNTIFNDISWSTSKSTYYAGEPIQLLLNSEKALELNYSVVTVNGQLLGEGKLITEQGSNLIDLPIDSDIPSGHLFIQLRHNSGKSVRRCLMVK